MLQSCPTDLPQSGFACDRVNDQRLVWVSSAAASSSSLASSLLLVFALAKHCKNICELNICDSAISDRQSAPIGRCVFLVIKIATCCLLLLLAMLLLLQLMLLLPQPHLLHRRWLCCSFLLNQRSNCNLILKIITNSSQRVVAKQAAACCTAAAAVAAHSHCSYCILAVNYLPLCLSEGTRENREIRRLKTGERWGIKEEVERPVVVVVACLQFH